MTFYLKYRPQRLEELDLKDVRQSLMKIVKSKKIPHAFLFSGPKGSGKTSAARILAKIVNCEKRRANSIEPCNKCHQCTSITKGGNVDVIELDAASHRGIDDVRSLRSAVKLAPAKANKKVYIIDESHMLTTEASNALLKTLEEPPAHVMFILATTNPEKLIETIRSRTINIVFTKATTEELVRSLKKKVRGERLKTEDKVLKLISEASQGSFRDADKILEQLVTEKVRLKEAEVEEFLFQRKVINIDRFLSLLAERETKKALEEVERVVASGLTIRTFLEELLTRLRSALMAKVGLDGESLDEIEKDDLVVLIKLFSRAASELPSAILEQIPVEIAVVEWCQPESVAKSPPAPGQEKEEKSRPRRARKKPAKAVASKSRVEINDRVWAQILSAVKPKNTSTEALLRAARPLQFDGETLELEVFYPFHKERLESLQNIRLLEAVIAEILGSDIRIVCTLSQSQVKGPVAREVSPDPGEDNSALAEPDKSLTEADDEDIIRVAKEIFGH